MMDKSISIRRVKAGDEDSLAYVQTESWKEAFREIVPADILSQCTEIERAVGRCQRGEHEGICGTDLHSFAQG